MPSCSICIDDLKIPVSLPCGHIFCKECIIRAIQTIKPYNPVHFCPTCRASYAITNMDPNLIPSHLRLHMVPSLRRVYLDATNPHVNLNMSHRTAISECARLHAENSAMKMNCSLWRRRAEVHAGATLGLLALARDARDHALKWKNEKEELERQLNTLKRKFEGNNGPSELFPPIPRHALEDDTSGYETAQMFPDESVTALTGLATQLDDDEPRSKRIKLAITSSPQDTLKAELLSEYTRRHPPQELQRYH